MKLVFTICSNNYLAQAKLLGDTLLQHNPDYAFAIFLVDRLVPEIDYSFFHPFKIIPIEAVNINGFEQMFARYDITELNTSVKPFIFDYLFREQVEIEAIIYLDPDIQIYNRFTDLEESLTSNNIVLTPHFFTPIYDNFYVSEPGILNAGLYNLGFIAVKRSMESQEFLNWWMIKLKDQCYINFKNGLFVDQLWINFVPLYYEKVFILKHLGYNAAYWNLHERTITHKKGNYIVNDRFPLVFYHFSGYDIKKPLILAKYQTRFSFDQRPDIVPLFEDYSLRVLENNYEKYSLIPCHYIQLKEEIHRASLRAEGVAKYCKRKVKELLFKRLLTRIN